MRLPALTIGRKITFGFAFYGSVPMVDDPVEHAAGMIGQGQVLMSPLALAAEADQRKLNANTFGVARM